MNVDHGVGKEWGPNELIQQGNLTDTHTRIKLNADRQWICKLGQQLTYQLIWFTFYVLDFEVGVH